MATEFIADDSAFNGTDWDGQSANLQAAAFATRGAGAYTRSGVLPAFGDPLAYVSNGDMTGTLKAGAYWLANASAIRGGYLIVVPNDVVFTHPTAASSARVDRIIVEVADTGVAASSFKKVRLLTVASGGGTPPMPTPIGVGGSAILAFVTVAGNATSIGAAVDVRQWTSAAGGGIRFVNRSGAEASALPEGTPVYLQAERRGGIIGANAKVILSGPPIVRQDPPPKNAYSGGAINGGPNPAALTVTDYTLTGVLEGSLVEIEFTAVVECPGASSSGDGAGLVTVQALGKSTPVRYHSHGSPQRQYLSGTLKVTADTDRSVTAQMVLTLDANTVIGVVIGEVTIKMRELA